MNAPSNGERASDDTNPTSSIIVQYKANVGAATGGSWEATISNGQRGARSGGFQTREEALAWCHAIEQSWQRDAP